MYETLIALVIALVATLLFVNIYFRIRVFKYYKKLIKSRVEFDIAHVLNRKKMEEEILPRYPQSKEDILKFTGHLRLSARIAMVVFVLISFFGWVLMHYR